MEVFDVFGNMFWIFINEVFEIVDSYEGGLKLEFILFVCWGFNVFYWDFWWEFMFGVFYVFILGDYKGSLVFFG